MAAYQSQDYFSNIHINKSPYRIYYRSLGLPMIQVSINNLKANFLNSQKFYWNFLSNFAMNINFCISK